MIAQRCVLAVWLLALTVVANARLAPSADSSASLGSTTAAVTSLAQLPSSSGRQLLQNAFCPDGCLDSSSCVQDTTYGGLRCQKCKNNLRVNVINGMCNCAPGKYADPDNQDVCLDCPRNYYCPGGDYRYSDPPQKYECPANMITLVMRTGNIRACVNKPGWYYSFDSNNVPYVSPCPVDTYCVGNRKQRQCTPCPTGFSTDGQTMSKSVTSCVVPPGYYLKSPGQVAPCPKGEWKEGVGGAGNCTKCAFGVTTLKDASTSAADCAFVVSSYYPAAFDPATGIISAAKVCPQGYLCPGGKPTQAFSPASPGGLSAAEPTIKKCPNGMWTIDVGSTDDSQCLTPPGHYTDVGAGQTKICPDGSFRPDWKPASQATSCTPCGDGVFADKSDTVTKFDISTYATINVQITTTADDCYIKAGQGLYYGSTSNTWRARNCDDNTYGVTNKTYGLSTSTCRACPMFMVTSKDKVNYPNSASHYVSNGDGTGGFVDQAACVTQDGYGVSGRGAQPCDQGKYNKHDSYSDCASCPLGTTTSGVGTGATLADCGLALGFGYDPSVSSIVPCPIGTYNPNPYSNSTTRQCTQCPSGSTTMQAGGDSLSSCNLCSAGYGGANCAQQCGGPGTPTYGPPGREYGSACTDCMLAETGFSFEFAFNNDIYAPRTVAPVGAAAPHDCLAEFGQMMDGAWYLPTTGNTGMTSYPNVMSWGACVNLCSSSTCQYVTYDYNTRVCYVRSAAPIVFSGEPLIGFKAIPSGDIGVNAASVRNGKTRANGVSSGQYTFYQDPNALDVGYQTAPANAMSFTQLQDCMSACDNDVQCAGITITMKVVIITRPQSCKLIRGDRTLGTFKRSMTRVDVNKLAIPSLQ